MMSIQGINMTNIYMNKLVLHSPSPPPKIIKDTKMRLTWIALEVELCREELDVYSGGHKGGY